MRLWRLIGGDLLAMSGSHAAVRGVVLLAGMGFVAALDSAGPLQAPAAVAMFAAVLLAAWHPHTVLPLVAMGYLVLSWVALVPAGWSIASLPAALCLVTLHTGAAVCSAAPPAAPVPPGVWRLYARRLGVVAGLTLPVWAVAPVVQRAETPGLLPALAGFLTLLVLLVAHYRSGAASPQVSRR